MKLHNNIVLTFCGVRLWILDEFNVNEYAPVAHAIETLFASKTYVFMQFSKENLNI